MASSGESLPDRCVRLFPCLSDPVRRGALCVRFSLVAFHVVAVGILFLWDAALVERTRREPWWEFRKPSSLYTAVFLGLFVVTLIQYFFTAGSSPGYVEDAMRTGNVKFEGSPLSLGISKQSASSETACLLPSSDNNQLRRNVGRMNSSSWSTMVMELYPQGTTSRNWHCVYCLALQPPRSKHCHDCEKCVLQFDHHCVWLGTCIGQKNHCRFWWYVVEEAILCLWTVILYISYLERKVRRIWWKDAVSILIVIILLLSLIFLLLLVIFHTYLILTNQTTYELVRRRRIPYLRNLPEKTRPFSKGICLNLHSFCCSFGSSYILEAFPTAEELEDKMKPYTCMDVISCRCC